MSWPSTGLKCGSSTITATVSPSCSCNSQLFHLTRLADIEIKRPAEHARAPAGIRGHLDLVVERWRERGKQAASLWVWHDALLVVVERLGGGLQLVESSEVHLVSSSGTVPRGRRRRLSIGGGDCRGLVQAVGQQNGLIGLGNLGVNRCL